MKKIGIAIAITLVFNAAFTLVLFNNLKNSKEEFKTEETLPVHFANYKDGLINTKPYLPVPIDFVSASAKVTPAVVNITTKSAGGYDVAGGSGVIIASDGYIITNNHVIEEGSSIEVTLNNKRTYQAKLIGSDPFTDLALIKIKASGLSVLEYGNSDRVQVGEWVMAVGNPFNLASTVTAGIVSAKGRNIHILQGTYSIETFIQTDAVVNPGNSGGALVNARGDLIGINTAIISESGGYQGYSFAIPSNLVEKIVRDLKEYGVVQRAILGVAIADVDDKIAEDLDLPAIEGVFIRDVNPNSSAEDAGLRPSDVVIGVNGVKTSSVPELQEQIARYRPGDAVTLDVIRKNRKFRKYDVVLKNLHNTTSMVRR